MVSLKTRHNIAFKYISSELKAVDTVVCENWKARIPEICSNHESNNIFNADKTGLFFGLSLI